MGQGISSAECILKRLDSRTEHEMAAFQNPSYGRIDFVPKSMKLLKKIDEWNHCAVVAG